MVSRVSALIGPGCTRVRSPTKLGGTGNALSLLAALRPTTSASIAAGIRISRRVHGGEFTAVRRAAGNTQTAYR